MRRLGNFPDENETGSVAGAHIGLDSYYSTSSAHVLTAHPLLKLALWPPGRLSGLGGTHYTLPLLPSSISVWET